MKIDEILENYPELDSSRKAELKEELLGLFSVSVLLFDFWHHIRMHGDDTPKQEVKEGVANFLANYKR